MWFLNGSKFQTKDNTNILILYFYLFCYMTQLNSPNKVTVKCFFFITPQPFEIEPFFDDKWFAELNLFVPWPNLIGWTRWQKNSINKKIKKKWKKYLKDKNFQKRKKNTYILFLFLPISKKITRGGYQMLALGTEPKSAMVVNQIEVNDINFPPFSNQRKSSLQHCNGIKNLKKKKAVLRPPCRR